MFEIPLKQINERQQRSREKADNMCKNKVCSKSRKDQDDMDVQFPTSLKPQRKGIITLWLDKLLSVIIEELVPTSWAQVIWKTLQSTQRTFDIQLR